MAGKIGQPKGQNTAKVTELYQQKHANRLIGMFPEKSGLHKAQHSKWRQASPGWVPQAKWKHCQCFIWIWLSLQNHAEDAFFSPSLALGHNPPRDTVPEPAFTSHKFSEKTDNGYQEAGWLSHCPKCVSGWAPAGGLLQPFSMSFISNFSKRTQHSIRGVLSSAGFSVLSACKKALGSTACLATLESFCSCS